MIKLYTQKTSNFKMEPTKETLHFLLNFSKSLKIVKVKSNEFIKLNLN